MKRAAIGLLTALAALASSGEALAYCSATSCDPSDVTQNCSVDTQTECELSGEPLAWASNCLTFSIQKNAAPRSGIDYAAAKSSLERAFAAWTGADCGGKRPSMRVEISEPVDCDATEYNKTHRNANILIFREDEWPYEGGEDALGLTRVRFDPDQRIGELWDADIEINAVDEPLSIGEPGDQEVDLDSLMTHEVGHALGMGHSLDVQATMIAGYLKGSTGLRSLATDDVLGICEKYPPGRKPSSTSCELRHGFSTRCGANQLASEQPLPLTSPPTTTHKGCAVSPGSGRELGSLLTFLALLSGVVSRRKKILKK